MSTEFQTLKRQPSLAARVTQELLDSIVEGKLRSGQRLPSERELSEQFGVSRTVIREAVRGLQAKGVVEVRSGRGVEVAAVTSAQVTETFDLFVKGQQIKDNVSPDHISEVREMLELRVVALACERGSAEDLQKVEGAFQAMEQAQSTEDLADRDSDFHMAIALATGNPLLVTLLESVNATIRSVRRESLRRPGRKSEAQIQHRAVLDGILSRDTAAAVQAMSLHLDDSKEYYQD
jgi:GntR family transcriptional regulator, transcriptional repressor for pyruvate dehydrogenase complex